MLASVWDALGGDPALVDLVTAVGDVGLTSAFAVGRLALGAVGAQLLAAEELAAEELVAADAPSRRYAAGRVAQGTAGEEHSRLRRVELDARHVGIAFRSERFLAIDGVASGPGFAPLSRFVSTADG